MSAANYFRSDLMYSNSHSSIMRRHQFKWTMNSSMESRRVNHAETSMGEVERLMLIGFRLVLKRSLCSARLSFLQSIIGLHGCTTECFAMLKKNQDSWQMRISVCMCAQNSVSTT